MSGVTLLCSIIILIHAVVISADTVGGEEADDGGREKLQGEQSTVTFVNTTTGAADEEEIAEANPQQLHVYYVVTEAAKLLPYKIATILQLYYMPIMSFCGLIGNLLSGMVMMQRANRRISSNIYILGLACTDSVCLVAAFYHWVMSDGPVVDLQRRLDENRIECKVIGYISAAAQLSSVFIVCAMTFDRVVAIRSPLQARHINTPKRTRGIIVLLVAMAVIIRLPYLWHTEPLGKRDCVAYLVKAPWITGMYWLNVSISYYIPFIFLLTANSLIINTIKNRRKYFDRSDDESGTTTTNYSSDRTCSVTEAGPEIKDEVCLETEVPCNQGRTKVGSTTAVPKAVVEDGNGHCSEITSIATVTTPEFASITKESDISGNAKSAKKRNRKSLSNQDLQLTVMLLTVTFAFLLLLLPIYVAQVIYMFKSYLESPQAYADYILAAGFGLKLIYTNNAINFYLYCISGSRFRADLKRIFCSKSKA